MEERYLTVKEVGGRLRVSRWSVGRLIKSGELEAVEVGGVIRIPESALSDFIQRHTVTARETR